jgi:Mg/Co/Ni transporter MgtE
MESDELSHLLRDAETERAAGLVAEMEPDEAADALRDLDDDTRAELLAAMPDDVRSILTDLLDYDERTAGGVMTTTIVVFEGEATVAEARRRIRDRDEHNDIDGVLVVDGAGRLVDDVPVIELFTAEPDERLRDLTRPPWPVTVTVDVPLEEVVEAFVENRGSSVVVVDEEDHPVGRILADDVVDALLPPERRQRRFAGLLS